MEKNLNHCIDFSSLNEPEPNQNYYPEPELLENDAA
jgi:hypothetical protein